METLGTVFAAECPGETTIKSKVKQIKGILNLSAHKTLCMAAGAAKASGRSGRRPLSGAWWLPTLR